MIFTLLAKLGQLYTYWEAISSIIYLDMMHVKWFCQISFLCHPTWALFLATRWINGIFACNCTIWHCACCCTSICTKLRALHIYITSYTNMYQVSKSNFKQYLPYMTIWNTQSKQCTVHHATVCHYMSCFTSIFTKTMHDTSISRLKVLFIMFLYTISTIYWSKSSHKVMLLFTKY